MPIEPVSAAFNYYGPLDGQRVDDPPEIAEALQQARLREENWSAREVPWDIAEPAIHKLGSRRFAGCCIRWSDGSTTYIDPRP
jgi:hypothetical protein